MDKVKQEKEKSKWAAEVEKSRQRQKLLKSTKKCKKMPRDEADIVSDAINDIGKLMVS